MPTPFPAPDAPLQALTRVYDGDVDGVTLRFYLPPTGQPEMPWVSLADLGGICPPNHGKWPASNIAFGLDSGATVAIIPYWLAAEMVRSARAYGVCDPAHRRELHAEAEIALNRAAQLQPQGQQRAYRDAARDQLHKQLGGE